MWGRGIFDIRSMGLRLLNIVFDGIGSPTVSWLYPFLSGLGETILGLRVYDVGYNYRS